MATRDVDTDLTAEQVRTALNYDPSTGTLTWRIREDVPNFVNARDAGRLAGYVHRPSTGHMKILFHGRGYFYHRLVWLHVTGQWPKMDLDHIDGDPRNNRFSNLREVTKSQNQMNQRKTYKMKLKGARFHKGTGRWQASILVRGKSHYLGLFPTPEAAHAAYCEAAAKLHGEFARTG